MSDRSRDTTHRHPADERTADQSTQSASGLGAMRPGPNAEPTEETLDRDAPERYDTPRRYEADDAEAPRRQP